MKGRSPFKETISPFKKQRRVKERRSLSYITNSPSPFKERGIQGVRLKKHG
jgi:hypothetical protein